jgi:hypothetical protein
MDFRMKVDDSFVKRLIEEGGWEKLGITPRMDEATTEVEETEETEEVVAEAEAEEHTCPLCQSTLEEELSEDTMTQHIEAVLALVEQLNEEEEEAEESEEEAEAEETEEEEEEEAEEA